MRKRSRVLHLIGPLLAALAFVFMVPKTETLHAEPTSQVTPTFLAIDADWLDAVNYYRSIGGLPAVTENETWSEGTRLHARYMVKTGHISHAEDPLSPWFTTEGDAAGRSSAIGHTNWSTDRGWIEKWMTAPFHGVGIIRPPLTATGFGSYSDTPFFEAAALDVWRGYTGSHATEPVLWPGDGTTVPLSLYPGNEYPNPLTSCPGYSGQAGLPIYVQLPETPDVESYSVTHDGDSLDVCEFDQTNYANSNGTAQALGRSVLASTNTVVLMPRLPLAGGEHDVELVSGSRTINWHFFVAGGDQTEVSLTSDPNPSASGQEVTLTARVTSPYEGTPTGTVSFRDECGTTLGSAPVVSSPTPGVATLDTTLSDGAHRIMARFEGNGYTPQDSEPLLHNAGRREENLFGIGWQDDVNHPAGVQMASGNLVSGNTDIALSGGPLDLTFDRVYNSLDARVGSLGEGWTHTYDQRVIEHGATNVELRTGTGQRLTFCRVADEWVGELGSPWKLKSVAGGRFEASNASHELRAFDTDGKLTQITHRAGSSISLTYDASDRIATVTGPGGRTIAMTYDGSGRLTEAAASDGSEVTYAYASGRLSAVTTPKGVAHYSYAPNGYLSDISSVEGSVLAIGYAPSGRVASLTRAGGDARALTWDESASKAKATDGSGREWTYEFAGNLHKRISSPAGRVMTFDWDANLNLSSVTDSTGKSVFHSDDDGHILEHVRLGAPDEEGERPELSHETHAYDEDGNRVSTTDASGATTEMTYDPEGDVTSIEDPLGNTTTFEYDSNGNRTGATDPADNTTTASYDAFGRTIALTDQRGGVTAYEYSTSDDVETVTDASGEETSFSYDAGGRLTSVTDALGHETTYDYDEVGRVTSATNANGDTASIDYDLAGRTSALTDAAGGTTTYLYDATGHLLSRTNGEGETTTFEYDEGGFLSAEISPTGKRTVYEHDALGRLTAVTDPAGGTTRYAYDGLGRRTSVIDANDGTTEYTYDTAGNLESERNPLGEVITFEYDAAGRRVAKTSPGGSRWSYQYDDAGMLVSSTDPKGGETETEYDAAGNKTAETNQAGETTTYSYDPLGHLLSRTDPMGDVESNAYDDVGRLTAATDALENVTTFAYDSVGNLMSQTDPIDNTTSHTYDEAGRQTSITDPVGRTTTYGYDDAGRVVSVEAPGGATTAYAFDDDGNRTAVTDANGHTTTYGYDNAGRLAQELSPGASRTTFAYDPAGQLVEKVNPNGTATPVPGDGTTTYGYDGAGRILNVHFSEWTTYSLGLLDRDVVRDIPNVTFEYDANGNRKAMFDAYGKTTYTYDASDQLARIHRNGWGAINYAYDAAGRITSREYAGTKTNFTFDDAGRVSRVTDGGKNVDYGYDAEGNLIERQLPNGVNETRSYDDAGRVTRITAARGASTVSDVRYDLDPAGAPLKRTDLAGTEVYEYDPRGQLKRVCYAPACSPTSDGITYGYDSVGNRLTETRPGGTTTYAYDVDDRMTLATGPLGATTYTHDPNGNLIAKGNVSYGYDPADHLVAIQGAAAPREFHYDGDGRRVAASVYGSGAASVKLQRFLWDSTAPDASLVAELTDAGTTAARYVHGAGLVSSTRPTGTSYYHQDRLGSVVALTNANGESERTYAYEPFGAERSSVPGVSQPSTSSNPLQFAGEYLDAGSGLYHLRARELDPGTGRFLQRDPQIRDSATPGMSTYAYAENQPTNLIDPSGESARGLCAYGQVMGPNLTCVPQASLLAFQAPQAPVMLPPTEGAATGGKWVVVGEGIAFLEVSEACLASGPACAAIFGVGIGIEIHRNDLLGINDEYEEVGGDIYDLFTSQDEEEAEIVYRVWGGASDMMGEYWTPVDPRTVSDYRFHAALPDSNLGDRLVIGLLIDSKGVKKGPAEGLYSYKQERWLEGGLMEYWVPHPEAQIRAGKVEVLSPPY